MQEQHVQLNPNYARATEPVPQRSLQADLAEISMLADDATSVLEQIASRTFGHVAALEKPAPNLGNDVCTQSQVDKISEKLRSLCASLNKLSSYL